MALAAQPAGAMHPGRVWHRWLLELRKCVWFSWRRPQTCPAYETMNPIVEALLKDFSARQEIDASDAARAFESFVAYCILSAERLDQGDFRDSLTDRGEEGLDAVAIIVNGTLVADPSDIESILQAGSTLNVKYVFVQAKSSERWDGGDVLKFTRAVRGFFNGINIGSSSVVEAARQVHAAVLGNAARLEENPQVRASYAATGKLEAGTAASRSSHRCAARRSTVRGCSSSTARRRRPLPPPLSSAQRSRSRPSTVLSKPISGYCRLGSL